VCQLAGQLEPLEFGLCSSGLRQLGNQPLHVHLSFFLVFSFINCFPSFILNDKH
jgi:hypothetical protein